MILVVEDDPDAEKALSVQLAAAGYCVLASATLAAAIEAAASDSPSLIVLDLGLPDGDGSTLLREMKAGTIAAKPVIVVSARGNPDEHARATELGASDYFQKPVRREWLLQAIEKALKVARESEPAGRR